MKRLNTALVFAALVFGPAVTPGQDHAAAAHAPQQGAHKPQGFADYALGKVNPNDKDYGAEADSVRGATVEHSIDDLYFWSNVVTLTLLAGVTAILLFHLRGADKREVISATLIAQLWNGRVSDRIEIERRTEQYNSLVEQHNAEVERALSPKSQAAEGDKQSPSELTRTVGQLTERPLRGGRSESGDSSVAAATGESNGATVDTEVIRLQQKNVLLERRVEAMRNTEQNLKERLNQTASQLDQERKRNQTLKGA
jgi:hypothetical protein